MTVDLQPIYPLSKAQVDEISLFHEADALRLEGQLNNISETCQHNCTTGIQKCATHQNEMRKLYQDAYTTISPNRWASYRPAEYVDDLKRLFDTQASIEKINERVQREICGHIEDSQCTLGSSDHPIVKATKKTVAEMYDAKKPQAEIDAFITETENKLRANLSSEQQEIQIEYDKSKSEVQKYSYLRTCACTPKPTDTPRDIELRLKWTKLFDAKAPYQEILVAMEKDIADSKSNMQLLENRLADLRNAQAANNKAKAAKEEAKLKQARDSIRYCCSEGCGNVCQLDGPNSDLGCERCYNMKEDGLLPTYSWFCSPQCAQANAGTHNAKFHSS